MAPVAGLRGVRAGNHGENNRQWRGRCGVAVLYRRHQRRFKASAPVLADIQRQRTVRAGSGVILNAAVTRVAVVNLYGCRLRTVNLLIRPPNAVAARKDNRRVRHRLALGIQRGDGDRNRLADLRFSETIAVVILRRSQRYLRRHRMGVLQTDKIEFFIPQQRTDAAVAQINRLNVAVFRCPA